MRWKNFTVVEFQIVELERKALSSRMSDFVHSANVSATGAYIHIYMSSHNNWRDDRVRCARVESP